MKAVILAAGYGRRMRPLTDDRHKTLLPIAGTTILRRILDSLAIHGVTDICIVTGYRDGEIRELIDQHYSHLDVEFVHNKDYATTNNVFSMALALEEVTIQDSLLLIESDLIFDPRVLGQLIESSYPNSALVDRYRSGLDGTVVSIGRDSAITQVHPSYLQGDQFDFADKYKTLNIYKFDADFCNTTFRRLLSFYSRSIDDNCYYELLLGVLIYMRAATVHAVEVSYPWAEVDDPNDLQSAEYLFNESARLGIVERAWGGAWNFPHVDFAFIRNMHFPTPAMRAELRSNLDELLFNYGSSQQVLDRKAATFELCDPERIVLLNGASQAFPILGSMLNGRRVLRPAPTFGEYSRIFPDAATYADRASIAWEDDVVRRMGETDVLVVVNPNNPTGTTVRAAEIITLAARHPSVRFIVDESFVDFSEEPSVVPLLEAEGLENVVVLKSLSKALGVPGVRLGWLYCPDLDLVARVREALPVWNVNSVAEHFLEIILKHRDSLDRSFALTKSDREDFAAMLRALGVVAEVYPSGANFLLVRLRVDAEETARLVGKAMARHQVHLKDVSRKFGDGRGYLRLAVRQHADHELACALISSLSQEFGLAG